MTTGQPFGLAQEARNGPQIGRSVEPLASRAGWHRESADRAVSNSGVPI